MDFRLLVPASEADKDIAVIALDGVRWRLSAPLDLEADTTPPYTCISYRWGVGRQANAFHSDMAMSNHTLPSLEAALRTTRSAAFWTDALCIPANEPARQATLEAMGYIYARACEVVIVLSSPAGPVLREMQMQPMGWVDESALHKLEAEEWVESVWTYQEIVNAKFVTFVAEHCDETVEGSDLFSALGYSLAQLRIPAFTLLRTFPHLNALLTVLGDWRTASFAGRSVFATMCGLAFKHNSDPANYFYAMLGALSASPDDLAWYSSTQQSLGAKVMAICEAKGDFSFIYSVAPREVDPVNNRWRPLTVHSRTQAGDRVPEFLRPIFAWDCWGDAQPGRFDEHGRLLLESMVTMQVESEALPSVPAQDALRTWMDDAKAGDAITTLSQKVYTKLQEAGFEGHPQPLVVRDGLVFTLGLVADEDVTVLVSTQIRYPFGAPGVARMSEGPARRYMPCLFLGRVACLLEEGQDVVL